MSRIPLSLLLAGLLPAAACAGPGHEPLRPASACLDPDRARGWVMRSSDELLVDAGRRHYRIRLSYACPELGTGTQLAFEAGALGRICGDVGEAVRAVDRVRGARSCDIDSVEAISQADYQTLAAGGSVGGKAGEAGQ